MMPKTAADDWMFLMFAPLDFKTGQIGQNFQRQWPKGWRSTSEMRKVQRRGRGVQRLTPTIPARRRGQIWDREWVELNCDEC